MQELLIETIRTDSGVQSRERISDEYVADLAEAIKGGKKLPPIEVYGDGDEVWCADGFHRIRAHVEAGKRTIRCNVHKGGQQDAAWASCAANQEHGLRRTNADKRRSVEMALRMRPGLSARAVADHVGVDEAMVRQSKVRCGIPAPEQVTGRDGKTYRVPPPPTGRKAIVPPPQSDTPRRIPPPPGGGAGSAERTTGGSTGLTTGGSTVLTTGRGAPAGGRPAPPTPLASAGSTTVTTGLVARPAGTQDRADRLDEVGKPIPDHLIPLFDRGQEVQALLGQISSIKGVLKRAEASGDVLFAELNFNSALAAIETLHMEVKATKPFAVCPWCHGTLSDQCRGCGHRGVLGEYRWNTIVPRELK